MRYEPIGLDPLRLRLYVKHWRQLADERAAIAGQRSEPWAIRMRRSAQLMLFAAHEVERVLLETERRLGNGAAPESTVSRRDAS